MNTANTADRLKLIDINLRDILARDNDAPRLIAELVSGLPGVVDLLKSEEIDSLESEIESLKQEIEDLNNCEPDED